MLRQKKIHYVSSFGYSQNFRLFLSPFFDFRQSLIFNISLLLLKKLKARLLFSLQQRDKIWNNVENNKTFNLSLSARQSMNFSENDGTFSQSVETRRNTSQPQHIDFSCGYNSWGVMRLGCLSSLRWRNWGIRFPNIVKWKKTRRRKAFRI